VRTANVIDDHLGFIARGADDLTNLELGFPDWKRQLKRPYVIEQMIHTSLVKRQSVCGRRHEKRGNIWPIICVIAVALLVLILPLVIRHRQATTLT